MGVFHPSFCAKQGIKQRLTESPAETTEGRIALREFLRSKLKEAEATRALEARLGKARGIPSFDSKSGH